MTRSVVFRRLTVDDAGAFGDLDAETARVGQVSGGAVVVCRLAVPAARASTFGAEIGGRLVGWSRVEFMSGEVWALTGLYVQPVSRRRGVGRALVSAALGAVPPRSAVEVEVAADDTAISAWYERLGFVHYAESVGSPLMGWWRRRRN